LGELTGKHNIEYKDITQDVMLVKEM